MNIDSVRRHLRSFADVEYAKFMAKYFKAESGDLAEGDVFLGIRMPQIRKVSKRCCNVPLSMSEELLQSKIHEERMLALLILVEKYKKGSEEEKDQVYQIYLENIDAVNHWDLVDQSARFIVGPHLEGKAMSVLKDLVASHLWWRRRIAILSTFYSIRQNSFKTTLEVAKMLLCDEHDLVQKAVGWMIKEISKRNLEVAEHFLNEHYANMPRTMLRSAIEKFSTTKRKAFLVGALSKRRQ